MFVVDTPSVLSQTPESFNWAGQAFDFDPRIVKKGS